MNFESGVLRHTAADGLPTGGWRKRAAALRTRLFCILLAVDCIAIAAGFGVAAVLRGSISGTVWLLMVPVLLPVYLATAINARAYSSETTQDPFRAIRTGLTSLLIAFGAVIFVAFGLKASENFARIMMGVGFVLSALGMTVARYLVVVHIEAILGGNPFKVILICDPGQPIPEGEFSVIVASDSNFDPETHDPLMYDRLSKALQSADRVVVSCSPERRLRWAHALKGANVQSEILAPELAALAPLGMGRHGDMPTVIVANGALGTFDRLVKRLFDIVVAGGALVVLAVPLALIALAIRLDSRGPVLFKQTRIGRGNQMFRMLKFRSMRVDGCDGHGARSTARDDSRITRVGRILRSTSIDELPQLVNVLRGDMSIVGPRPHALGSRAADKLFWEVDHRYWHRHATKPGLTGLAQVRGFRGATLIEADLENRLRADLEYLEAWSIWRDIKIIVLTFRVILHRNAF